VARELEVPGRPLVELALDRPRVVINATPVGSAPDDPTLVPIEVFRRQGREPRRIAFDMVYEPADTPFLRAARAAGAVEIPGREMLVAQGAAQFRCFTGASVTLAEFDESYRRGAELRRRAVGR
jgi:shikimate dehydrogenase